MSCGGATQNFRLLDGFVGWDKEDCANLTGVDFDKTEGLRLAQVDPDVAVNKCSAQPSFISAGSLLSYLPPPRLARGCGRCDWFLANENRLLRHDCCSPGWQPVWSVRCDQGHLEGAVAVAARNHRVAVSDAKAKRVWIWACDGERLAGSINTESLVADPDCRWSGLDNRIVSVGPLAFSPWGELLVADAGTTSIWRFGPTGDFRGKLQTALPIEMRLGTIRNLAVSDDCSIWVVTGVSGSGLRLWSANRDDKEFRQASLEELQESFKPSGLTAANETGFCIDQCGPEGLLVSRCFKWCGAPADNPIPPPAMPELYERGQLLTRALDSGIPRCRWHRVRIDADIPSGSNLEIAVATSEAKQDGGITAAGDSSTEGEWKEFNPGIPHHLDWQTAPAGALDFLIDQPPGRLLYVRLRLKGNKQVTPVVRRLRLDFPRVTSLEYLPAVYRENPEAEDFTERFLALFDASLNDLDRAIERSPALLDTQGVPDEVLPWLAGFLDLVFDPVWPTELRRKVLSELPDLYRRRGTIKGLSQTIKLIFGVDAAIQELATERDWGSVSKSFAAPSQNPAHLGTVRLFGKSRARFRLNTSPLGKAPLRSYGNPDHDPLLAHAFRLRVLVPPLASTSPTARQRLEHLVASQKPAHTVATIRFGGEGFLLGDRSAVGVDTVFGHLPPPVLGKTGNVRLARDSVIWHGRHGLRDGIRLGETSIVGVRTVAA